MSTASSQSRPHLSFGQILNMNIGFFGIQYSFGLQQSNMSPIYKYLGANEASLPLLWLAGPMTGLLVQPIIGAMSDRTWCRLGRRRPYFLTGAILSSLALIAMPNASAVWMAAGLLWILDASINISMEPFRAFVADKLPEEQRSTGFSMQSLFIGLGAVIASGLPWMMTNWFHVTSAPGDVHAIPITVRYSFYLGALAFFGAVLWTVVTSKEYPPPNLVAFHLAKSQHKGVGAMAGEIFTALKAMPLTMKQLALVQLSTWLGLFCMWLYFTPAVSNHVFGAPNPQSPLYRAGNEWAGLCYLTENAVTFFFAFVLLGLAARMSRRHVHSLCLLCGAAGLISVGFIHGVENRAWLHVSLGLVGIAWASILAMPYAMLAGALPPEKTGVYMGIFNFFIVLPEIAAALCFDKLMGSVLHNNQVAAVMIGGGFLLLAALLVQFVTEVPAASEQLERVVEEEGMLPTMTPPESPLA